MDFTINRMKMVAYLTKCRLGGSIKDIVISGANDQISSRFADAHRTMYCELYEPDVRIAEKGVLKIGNIDQVISTINRSDSESIRVKLVGNYFLVTDGAKAGKFKAKISTIGDAEFIESFQSIKDKKDLFDREKLTYVGGKYAYETGFEIPHGSLSELLKDAKAFGFENYTFEEKEGILNCTIENRGTKDSFVRRLITIGKIGSGEISRVTVGAGFREMVTSLDKEVVDKGKLALRMYFNKSTVLITNGTTYFYNLHVID